MPGRRARIRNARGELVEGTLVNVEESTERFSDIKLEDGTVMRIKVVVIDALRVDDQWDVDGHPVYVVKSNNVVVVSESPEELKRVEQ